MLNGVSAFGWTDLPKAIIVQLRTADPRDGI